MPCRDGRQPRRAHEFMAPLALWAAACLVFAAGGAQAADPTQRWRTITTPHFFVHYYRSARHDEAEVAQRVAKSAERAHVRLAPVLGHSPSSRTHIVVTDDTDGANGSAQIVPMNLIRIYVTGPTSLSALNDYDNWIYGLLLHEYTHILHIDTIHGLARLVNVILGKTWAPNQIQPRWFIEGLAVYYESAMTSGGRNRNAIYDMYLRTAVLEKKLLKIDQISSMTRYFPRGTVPYLYGSRFVEYLANRFGRERLTKISHQYGGTPVPYGINRTAKKILGHSFIELYRDFETHITRRYELQKAAVERRGRTAFRKVTRYGESCSSPRFSADGKELVFIDTDGRSQTAVKVMALSSGKVTERFDSFGGAGVGFTPDGEHLVYGQARTWMSFYHYSDVYVRHRRTGEVRRLTDGLRARDPAVSPDGRQVAFTINELGTMSLALAPFDGGKHQVLLQGKNSDQVHAPRWSPDGRSLVFSRWRQGGHRDIYLIDVATRRLRRLTSDRALDTDPVFSPDGRRIYFASDRTGIFNVFCYEVATGKLWQVSNVLTGAFVPAVSPDEAALYFVGFSSIGFDLHAMKIDRGSMLPALPYVNDRPAAAAEGEEASSYPEEAYSPLQTIYPRAWTINWGTDAYGYALGLEVLGGDVIGRHRYSVVTNISLEKGYGSYALAYAYNRLWPILRFDTSRYEGNRGGVIIDGVTGTYHEENYGFGGSVGLPLLRVPNHAGDVSVGYRVNWLRNADETEVLVAPGELAPRMPEVGVLTGLTVGVSYRSIQRYPHSISAERGRAIGLGLRIDHPSLGSDFQSTQITYYWHEYIDLPWAHEHVLALRLAGGVARGDLRRRGMFFVGGFPEQDILRAIFETERVNGAFLRGYPPGVVYGDQYHLFNLEYRMPLFDIERGFSSLPLYFNHVHLTVFSDVGNAFFGGFSPSDLKVGVGGEIMVEAVIGYYLPSTFRIGYARGLMEQGGNEFHFMIGNSF